MSAPIPTPYDGSSPLFEIGLKRLDFADWIDADDLLPAFLAEKDRLLAMRRDAVFAAEPGTDAAQTEVLALLAEYLPQRFPAIYRRVGDMMEIGPAARQIALSGTEAPLLTAARLVQEDLLIMRRGESGWRLAAASLCFPSSWRLGEKIGRPINEIHAPVPGFGPGTRPAELIARMFDNLQPAIPVIRWNWSLYGDAAFFHPESSDARTRRFGAGEYAENVFLRVERQTLRKLPQSADILFTVRIHVDPLAALERHPDAARIAATLIAQIEALNPEQLDYKGLTLERERLVARLREVGKSSATER